jgi:hypothetical protein
MHLRVLPVLLVKKVNNTWQFCIDYCKLNLKKVKHKFLIPREDGEAGQAPRREVLHRAQPL